MIPSKALKSFYLCVRRSHEGGSNHFVDHQVTLLRAAYQFVCLRNRQVVEAL
jgi:hypothetical protein